MEKQLRIQNDTTRQEPMHLQKDSLFYHERLCQDIPYEKQMDATKSLVDQCRYVITQLLMPRLVVIRVKHVLAATMPLLNLADDGTFAVILHGASSVLSPIGWVLHGLRLLINAVQLLLRAIPSDWMTDADKALGWRARSANQVQKTGVQLGNDLIWIIAALMPASLTFTIVLLLVDIVWIGVRAYAEINRSNSLYNHADEANPNKFNAKLALNLCSTISISVITIIKTFLLPELMPVLASNPIPGLVFALAVLMITIVSHLLGQYLEHQKSSKKIESRNSLGTSLH